MKNNLALELSDISPPIFKKNLNFNINAKYLKKKTIKQ